MEWIGWIIAAVLTALVGGAGIGWRLRRGRENDAPDARNTTPNTTPNRGSSAKRPTPLPEPIPPHEVTDHADGVSDDNPVGDFLDEYYGERTDD